jgi:hypothetical protein
MTDAISTDLAAPRRRAVRYWLVGLEAALAVAAFGGAIGLLTGAIPMTGDLQDVPYASSVLAGVTLALLNGVLPTVAAVAELRRNAWATFAHVVVGVTLIGWIVVQVAIIGLDSWLQPLMAGWGAAILVLAGATPRRSEQELGLGLASVDDQRPEHE